MGNLTRDPEIRHTPSGQAVSDLGLAISKNYRNKAGELVESTCFADIVVRGRQAEACGQFCPKDLRSWWRGGCNWTAERRRTARNARVKATWVQFLSQGSKTGQVPTEEAGPPIGCAGEKDHGGNAVLKGAVYQSRTRPKR